MRTQRAFFFIVFFLFISVFRLSASILVLGYHKIIKDNLPFTCTGREREYLEIKESTFKSQVKWLKENGYLNLDEKKLLQFLKQKKDDGKKYVLFTFDDGYKSVITTAYPILEEFGYRGFAFVIPSVVGKKIWNNDHLDKKDLKFLQSKGWTIQNHTYNHFNLQKIPLAKAKEQIFLADEWIVEEVGEKPLFLAYPQGQYNNKIINYLAQKGYRAAFTTRERMVNLKGNHFLLPRYFPLCSDRLKKFIKKIKRLER